VHPECQRRLTLPRLDHPSPCTGWRTCNEAPELAAQVVAALPAHVITTFQGIQRELVRRPHPLSVGVPETWWSCNSCGTAFDAGRRPQ
jgi:hypothetical protein